MNKIVNSHLNWLNYPSWVFTCWERSGLLGVQMAILACDMVYCSYKGLYFTPSENPNSPGLHTHIYTHSWCRNRTWEAFPLTAHHHENLLTWQKALWWMTGLSRRLYSGALNYVLHSQIVVTEAFTGTMLTAGHRAGHITRYACCRSICATIENGVTATARTGGVQTQIRSPWMTLTW